MNRDLLINILLILAGIALAVALFGAGVLWMRKATVEHSVITGVITMQEDCRLVDCPSGA